MNHYNRQDLAVGYGDVTTAKITRKTLNLLLEVAKGKKRKIEHRRKGDIDNICINDKLFAVAGYGWCNLVIGL